MSSVSIATARYLSVLDLAILGDSALRLQACTVEELTKAAAQRRRGAPLLRTVIPLLDGRRESPWESVLRVLHLTAGIDVEPQKEIYDDWGRIVARADLWLVGTRRIREYDGEGIATGRSTETIFGVTGGWWRSAGNASGSRRHSCSMKVRQFWRAWINCSGGAGIRAAWPAGKPFWMPRCCGQRTDPGCPPLVRTDIKTLSAGR